MAMLIPLCFPLRYLSYQLKYLYSTLLGLILPIWVYGNSVYPIFLQHLIVFAIIKTVGPKCGKIVTFESIVYLSGYHIYEIIWNYGGWSLTAIALMLVEVCKYSLLAYNIEDGTTEENKLS